MVWDLGLDKIVSGLIPTFMRKPRMFHWMSSLVFPLDVINGQFVTFAEEKKLEAQLNSQTQLMEDYLNRKFSPLFPNPSTDLIQIKHGIETAGATFNVGELTDPDGVANPPYLSGNMVVYNEAEDVNIETIDVNNEYVSIQNNKVLSSVSDLEFEVSGTFEVTKPNNPIIDWGDNSAGVGHIGVRISAGFDLVLLVLDGIGGNAEQIIAPSPTASNLTNFTLKLVDSIVYVDGIEVATISPTLINIALNISLSQECRISNTVIFGGVYASSIIHGCKLNGEIFNFNENTGSVVTGSNGTTGALISTANTEDMWGDDNGAKESPFTYFDTEDFGTLPEDFRLILPESIEGDQSYVRSIMEIVDRYVIDTNKYDIVYR